MKTELSLSHLLTAVDHARVDHTESLVVRGVSRDSRTVVPGGVFVAIAGAEIDSNSFVSHARANGAAVVVSEKSPDGQGPWIQVAAARLALAQLARVFYQFPDRSLQLTAITGTNGKTTTAYLLHSILNAAGHSCGLMSTIETIVGNHRKPAIRTTPEATETCENLAGMVAQNQTHAVMEVTSHALTLQRTSGIEFDRATFTNFSHEHLDFHKTPESYLNAKMRLFERLQPESIAILNADDETVLDAREKTRADVLTFGVRNPHADVTGKGLPDGQGGCRGEITFPTGKCLVVSQLHGGFNLHNILAAATVAWSLGVAPKAIQAGVRALQVVPGRLEEIFESDPFQVFVDFAHTPAALRQTLRICRTMCRNKLHLVFGCGGERDQAKRPLMGKIATEFADFTAVTSDNPRREDPEVIIRQITAGVQYPERLCTISDREEAIRFALTSARAGDVVLIAGRGHESHQEIGAERLPFDDRQVARNILREIKHECRRPAA